MILRDRTRLIVRILLVPDSIRTLLAPNPAYSPHPAGAFFRIKKIFRLDMVLPFSQNKVMGAA
jgi:hypothetical protein